jgi:hypothetical protein
MSKVFGAFVVSVGLMGCGAGVIHEQGLGVDEADQSTLSQRATSSSSSWHHARLESRQHARISIDFTTRQEDVDYKPQSTIYADNVWVNVSRGDLSASSSVEVAITNRDLFVGNGNAGYIQHYTETVMPLTLAFAEDGRFTGLLPQAFRINAWGYGGVNRVTQKVELQVNGERQADPMQPAHEPPYFNADFSKSPAE